MLIRLLRNNFSGFDKVNLTKVSAFMSKLMQQKRIETLIELSESGIPLYQRTFGLKVVGEILRQNSTELDYVNNIKYKNYVKKVLSDLQNFTGQELQDLVTWMRITISYGLIPFEDYFFEIVLKKIEEKDLSPSNQNKIIIFILLELSMMSMTSSNLLEKLEESIKNKKNLRLDNIKSVFRFMTLNPQNVNYQVIHYIENNLKSYINLKFDSKNFFSLYDYYLQLCTKYNKPPHNETLKVLDDFLEHYLNKGSLENLYDLVYYCFTNKNLYSKYAHLLVKALRDNKQSRDRLDYDLKINAFCKFKEIFQIDPEVANSLQADIIEIMEKNLVDYYQLSRLGLAACSVNPPNKYIADYMVNLNFEVQRHKLATYKLFVIYSALGAESKINKTVSYKQDSEIKDHLKYIGIFHKLELINDIYNIDQNPNKYIKYIQENLINLCSVHPIIAQNILHKVLEIYSRYRLDEYYYIGIQCIEFIKKNNQHTNDCISKAIEEFINSKSIK